MKQPTKVYISARFERRNEMKAVSKKVQSIGYEDVSRWLVLEEGSRPSEAVLRERANIDRDDVYSCDILVRFSDDLTPSKVPSYWCTASRFEETGMAEVLGKIIIVVGGNQSLFDRLEPRIHVATKKELLFVLRKIQSLKLKRKR